MKRKIIQLAGRTFVVSLPAAWVRKYGLQKSDELEVVQKHNKLVISTTSDISVPLEISVTMSGYTPKFVRNTLAVLHKVGYDEIEILYDSEKVADTVRVGVSELIGFEIVEKTSKRLVVKNVSGDGVEEFDTMVRRVFLVISSLAKESLELISDKKFSELSSVLHYEKSSNRLTNYLHRLLNKKTKGPKSVFLYLILWILESIGDEYRDLCIFLKDTRKEISPSLLTLYRDVNDHFSDYYKYFYTSTPAIMEVLRKDNTVLQQRLFSYSSKSKEEQKVLIHLSRIAQHVYDCFGSTAGKHFLQSHK